MVWEVEVEAYLERMDVRRRSLERAKKAGRVVMQAQIIAVLTSTTLHYPISATPPQPAITFKTREGKRRKGDVLRGTYESSIVTAVSHV